jgi:AcrR family transcriptional regulator
MTGRRSAQDALATRDSILSKAAVIATADGLEGVTIGRLAGDLGMSKSGVIGQFGSKEELQLATLDRLLETFRARVWDPVQHHDPGLPRLLAVCESWADYEGHPELEGGCGVAQVSFEFDGRPGRVHDTLAAALRRWRRTLIADITTAVEAGDLPADTDPPQVAFSLEALASGMNTARLLHGDTDSGAWALTAMRAVLGIARTPASS